MTLVKDKPKTKARAASIHRASIPQAARNIQKANQDLENLWPTADDSIKRELDAQREQEMPRLEVYIVIGVSVVAAAAFIMLGYWLRSLRG